MFLGRFSKKWGRVHEQELKDRKVKTNRNNSGVAWIRAVTKGIWSRVHEMWKDGNLDRHGHDKAEQAARLRQRHLREISVWCDLKDSGALSLSAAEKTNLLFIISRTQTQRRDSKISQHVVVFLSISVATLSKAQEVNSNRGGK